MQKRRTTLLLIVLAALLGGVVALFLLAQRRLADCAYVPIAGRELLPNAGLAPGDNAKLPRGWSAPAAGVELRGPQIGRGEGFEYDNDGRAIQLLGIGNYLQTPPIDIRPVISRARRMTTALTSSAQWPAHSMRRCRNLVDGSRICRAIAPAWRRFLPVWSKACSSSIGRVGCRS